MRGNLYGFKTISEAKRYIDKNFTSLEKWDFKIKETAYGSFAIKRVIKWKK